MSLRSRGHRCPHADIQFCPLYVASHGTGYGCDDGQLGDGHCAVHRGLNYAAEVELIRVNCPGVVERCEWRQALAERAVLRARNLRLNGIH